MNRVERVKIYKGLGGFISHEYSDRVEVNFDPPLLSNIGRIYKLTDWLDSNYHDMTFLFYNLLSDLDEDGSVKTLQDFLDLLDDGKDYSLEFIV